MALPKIGETFTLDGRPFTVIGYTDKKGQRLVQNLDGKAWPWLLTPANTDKSRLTLRRHAWSLPTWAPPPRLGPPVVYKLHELEVLTKREQLSLIAAW